MEKLPEIIHESWTEVLQPLFNDPKMQMIKTKVLPMIKWYPGSDHIFNVFKMPLTEIKVVILGQDPYHNGSANGYAFSVNSNVTIPASLKVIKEEIINSKVETQGSIDRTEWRELKHWRQQGVFLLNTALSVPVGEAGAHTGRWQWFTKGVIEAISKKENPPVWMLWGAKAQGFEGYILRAKPFSFGTNFKTDNIVLKAPHPAAQSYPDAPKDRFFVGTNQFKICNEVLKQKGLNPINW